VNEKRGGVSGGKGRVFVVCVDAGTLELIRPWVKQGHLPTFERLMREGATGEMIAEFPPITVNNTLSMVTGKNAGKHGVLHWLRRETRSGNWKLVDSGAFGGQGVWDIVGQAGRKAVVLNLPLTYPPRPLDGVMVTGLLTPVDAEEITFPPGLRKEIEESIGSRYPVLPRKVFVKGKEEEYLSSLLESLEIRYRTSRYILDRYPWDLFFVHFIETDFSQHFFWSYMDEGHPKHDPASSKRFGGAIREVYARIDRILAEYLKLLKQEDSLMVVSDHGAGPLYQKFYTNNWLMKEGFLKLKRNWTTRVKYLVFRGGLTLQNVHQIAVSLGLSDLQPRVNRTSLFESLLRKIFLSYHDVDWKDTEAFAMGGFGQIYVDPVGDKGGGAEKEYEDVRARIVSRLQALKIPGNGRPYVRKLFRKEELFNGPCMDLLPDILVLPEDGFLDPGDFEFFSNALFEPRAPMSGAHRENGMLFLWGGGVKRGIDLGKVRIYDIAPSMLYLMGLPVPDDMDGKVLGHAFENTGPHPCV
jgi:predicted AlkP superfamily phosphohydrolase/phosphomutase